MASFDCWCEKKQKAAAKENSRKKLQIAKNVFLENVKSFI